MSAPSPVFLLLAALVCSMVGRALLFRAAWEISKGWGIAVLCVPLAPFFFRRNYKELAHEGKNWRTMATVFGVLFISITGSTGSARDLWTLVPDRFRPAEYAEHQVVEPELPATAEEALEQEVNEGDESAPATAARTARATAWEARKALAEKTAAPEKKGFMARIAAIVHPTSDSPAPAQPAPAAPSPPAAATATATAATAAGTSTGTPVATLTPPMTVAPTLAERVAANQQEFARLADVYEGLKKERGYLKKWDREAIAAYNAEAAKYQAALAAARSEQIELNKKLVVAKK